MLRQVRQLARPLRSYATKTENKFEVLTKVVADEQVEVEKVNAKVKSVQAPNRKDTWAVSQRPRHEAMTGPRFDGRDLSQNPQPYAAIDLIAQEPIKFVHHMAACDGNAHGSHGGVQGHPRIFINVDAPGVHACQYCGNRFADESRRAEIEAQEPSELPSGFGPYLPGSLGP